MASTYPTRDLHECFEEALRVAGFADHGPVLVRPSIIPLYVTLGASTTSANDTYTAPPGQVYVVKEIRGHFAMLQQASEIAVIAALGTNLSPTQRAEMKMLNCKVRLEVSSGNQRVTEENDISLYNISPAGRPIRFDESGPGYIMPPNTKTKLTCQWSDTTAALITGNVEVGVQFSGTMLEVLPTSKR